jgi:hypothetical protein
MLPLLVVATALAGASPSEPVVQADSSIRTDVLIAASAADVRAVLADPRVAAQLSDGVVSVKVVGKEGPCDVVETTCKGITSPLVYTVRRCPTAGGFTETLLHSEDFDAQRTEWHLQSVSGGTLVTIEIQSQPRVPLPKRVVQAIVESSAVETLENLVRQVTGH